MTGYVKRMSIVILIVVLLACLGVSVASGQVPLLTGMFVCAIFLAFFLAWVLRMQPPQANNQHEAPQPVAASKEEQQLQLAQRYALVQLPLGLPENTQTLQMTSDLFAPHTVNLLFYCWKTETHLHFFPRWDSIEATLGLLEYLETQSMYQTITFTVMSIPIEHIICYTKEPAYKHIQSFTMLHYRNLLGDEVGLLMQDNAFAVLKNLLPHLDQMEIKSRQYPHSSQQISDITTKLQQLKALHMQALIDEEEYTTKKKQILTTL